MQLGLCLVSFFLDFWVKMVVPAGLASASWDRERLDAVERLEVESLLPLFWAAEVESGCGLTTKF